MKTFKLKTLSIIESVKDDILEHDIELLDGLIINREDEHDRWVIEAYIEQQYMDLFKRLEREREEIMLEVKITKKSNPPATFITSIIGINTIGDQMNVLFMGKIVDQRQSKIEETLRTLIQKGYQGEELLDRFKQLI
ncbi:MAG TPA: YwpF family protein [Bacillota bacterium]|nr:YwpF family protein [Bacillota bacterium]